MKLYAPLQLLLFFCLCLLALSSRANEATPIPKQQEISKEEAIARAQHFLRSTNRDKYWRVDGSTIKLREDGKFKDKIWDISFPPKQDGAEKNDLGSNSDPMAKLVTRMPFLMWVLIDTGKMYYNEYRAKDGRIFVIQSPAIISTE